MEFLDKLKSRKNNKGVVMVWLMILAGIFLIGMFYLIFTNVLYVHVSPVLRPEINALNETTAFNKTQALATYDLIHTIWRWWPLVLIFGLIFYGVVASQRREPDQYYR